MTATIGERIKATRKRLGLSQAQLVEGLGLSVSYVSLIEAGHRQPREQVLGAIADRLDVSVDYLRTGKGPGTSDALTLDLRFAELALRSRDAGTARDRFAAVVRQARELGDEDTALEAEWGLARAAKTAGDLDEAVERLESLVATPALPPNVPRASVVNALCHACLESGDLARAIEVGEATLRGLEPVEVGPFDRDARIELASTLVACYFRRGDVLHAHLLARATVREAEATESTLARAAAYWNAAIVAEARGDAATARTMTERALALYGETDNVRATASLRVNAAWLLLRSPDADLAQAEALLTAALDELVGVAGPGDVAAAETELARCHLLGGDPRRAHDVVTGALTRLANGRPVEVARARIVLSAALDALGDHDAALAAYRAAEADLAVAGSGAEVASTWRELADALAALGRFEHATAIYRRVADAAGVPATPGPTVAAPATAGSGARP